MNRRPNDQRKAYALQRMVEAIGRAIRSESSSGKDRAARWAAAWGVVGGIRTPPGIRLRQRTVLVERRKGPRRR